MVFPGLTCGAAEFQLLAFFSGEKVRNVLTIVTPVRLVEKASSAAFAAKNATSRAMWRQVKKPNEKCGLGDCQKMPAYELESKKPPLPHEKGKAAFIKAATVSDGRGSSKV